MLREHGHGVAKASLHLAGRAIDVRLSAVPLTTLRDAALSMGGRWRRLLPTVRLRAPGHRPRALLVMDPGTSSGDSQDHARAASARSSVRS